MELKDLEGIQSLDAVDYGETLSSDVYYGGRTVNVLRMRLCGVIYVCEEDPDDGYRSSMSSLRVDDPRERPMKNVFGHVLVRCEHRTFTGDKYSSGCDILRIYDIANDKLVLEVGTDNTDDYYPSYVANWNPENLHINEGVKDAAETQRQIRAAEAVNADGYRPSGLARLLRGTLVSHTSSAGHALGPVVSDTA